MSDAASTLTRGPLEIVHSVEFQALGLRWRVYVQFGEHVYGRRRIEGVRGISCGDDGFNERPALDALLGVGGRQDAANILTLWRLSAFNTGEGWAALADVLHLSRDNTGRLAAAAAGAIADHLRRFDERALNEAEARRIRDALAESAAPTAKPDGDWHGK